MVNQFQRHCAANAVGDFLIDIDANAATNVVGFETGDEAVTQEICYRLVRLQHFKDVRKFRRPTFSQAQ
jgi:hypothetical protein